MRKFSRYAFKYGNSNVAELLTPAALAVIRITNQQLQILILKSHKRVMQLKH